MRTPSLVLLVLLASCASPTNSSEGIELLVQSDKDVYYLATDTVAEPVLINRGSVTVYLPMNEYVAVQRFFNGVWSEPRPWFAVDGVGISFALEAGDTLRSWPMNFGYVESTPGVYRFIFDVARDPNGRQLLSETLRVSPSFELRP